MNTPALNQLINSGQLDQLAGSGLIVIDDALSQAQLSGLRLEAQNQLASFRAAQVHSGVQPLFRSDRIEWITQHQPNGAKFVDQLMKLAVIFNEAFYSGVRRVEAHYAHYPSGSFYAAHLDNPHSQSNRVFSCVYYLHEHWEAGFGGELEIEINEPLKLPDMKGCELFENSHLRIHPLPGRLVIFDSRLTHSVLLSHFDRLSVAAWMRSDDE
jgi:SM-20-related protein